MSYVPTSGRRVDPVSQRPAGWPYQAGRNESPPQSRRFASSGCRPGLLITRYAQASKRTTLSLSSPKGRSRHRSDQMDDQQEPKRPADALSFVALKRCGDGRERAAAVFSPLRDERDPPVQALGKIPSRWDAWSGRMSGKGRLPGHARGVVPHTSPSSVSLGPHCVTIQRVAQHPSTTSYDPSTTPRNQAHPNPVFRSPNAPLNRLPARLPSQVPRVRAEARAPRPPPSSHSNRR